MASSSSSSSESIGSSGKHGLKVSHQVQSRFVNGFTTGYRMLATAFEGNNMGLEVFRHTVVTINPETGETSSEFTGVVTASEFVELPIGAPVEGQTPPTYRTASVDVILATPIEAEEAWESIRESLTSLIVSLDLTNDLSDEEIETFGTFD